jgi:dihydroxyacetone kinase
MEVITPHPLKSMSEEQLKASHEALASKEPNQDQVAPQELSDDELQDVAGGGSDLIKEEPNFRANPGSQTVFS